MKRVAVAAAVEATVIGRGTRSVEDGPVLGRRPEVKDPRRSNSSPVSARASSVVRRVRYPDPDPVSAATDGSETAAIGRRRRAGFLPLTATVVPVVSFPAHRVASSRDRRAVRPTSPFGHDSEIRRSKTSGT